jgi:hypothetical protein
MPSPGAALAETIGGVLTGAIGLAVALAGHRWARADTTRRAAPARRGLRPRRSQPQPPR